MRFVMVQVTHILEGELAEVVADGSSSASLWASLQPLLGLGLYLLFSVGVIVASLWLYRHLLKITSLKLVKN